MSQLELHKKIDSLVQVGPVGASVNVVKEIIQTNQDAHQAFFAKADERWLDWLWDNGFLDAVKEKSEDQTQYGYRTPELNYLVKITEKKPAKVVDIMLEVPISTKHFNPEVVDRFLWICSTLPTQQLARMISKIHDERWIPLMGLFNRWGFEYEKMFKTLADAKDYDSILMLAEAILVVRTKEEVEKISNRASTDNPFYFSDLSYTKVFEYLMNVDDNHKENALAIAICALCDVLLTGEREKDNRVFEVEETFHLFDVDFFELKLGGEKHLSHRDDVRSLAATVKALAVSLIDEKCDDTENIQRLYKKHFAFLPDSRSLWRLRLFVLSLCPSIFKDELKQALFRIFETDRYHELISGTEYLKTLRVGFPVLSESNKREYIQRVIEYFVKKDQKKKSEKENWHKRYGWEILSSICEQLTSEENEKCEKSFGKKCDIAFEPEPSIGKIQSGMVRPRGPITLEEFSKLPVADIIKRLQTEWTPEKLRAQNTIDDFLNPLNAEGVGELLRADILKRLQDYINNAGLFFERDVIDQHYTYSFLRGIEETFRGNKVNIVDINWDNLINLCVAIIQEGEKRPFENGVRERDTFNEWLSGWTGVYSSIADVVGKLISEDNGKTVIDFKKYRDTLFIIINHLLAYPDPIPDDEKIESAKMKTKSPGSEEYLISDPFTMAINTVRGQAFQSFTLFVYQDGKKFNKEEKSKLSPDVKELYETILKNEKTQALMFMFGHYLSLFYFRDMEWIRGLLPQIFSVNSDKKDLYLAAWEGYLTTNLYKELFVELHRFYSRAIDLNTEDYTKRQYFKDLDEAFATHLALAFIYFTDFDNESDLFVKFWSKKNTKRHKEFISFIGRHCISRERANLWIKKNKVDIEKLKSFWDWALENVLESEALSGFGFWINPDKEVLSDEVVVEKIAETLKKSGGDIDWDYSLLRRLPVFAGKNREKTLEIISSYLLDSKSNLNQNRRVPMFSIDDEIKASLKIIYTNGDKEIKQKVADLINTLIEKGSSMFWGLKSVLDEEKPR